LSRDILKIKIFEIKINALDYLSETYPGKRKMNKPGN